MTALLTAERVRPRRLPAPAKLRVATTLVKAFMASNLSMLHVPDCQLHGRSMAQDRNIVFQ